MTDQTRAASLARRGFDLWQEQKHEEAQACYIEALALADPNHYGLPDYHGEYACVLSELGQMDDAKQQFELALDTEIRISGDETGIGAVVARYFLADHLLRNGDPDSALQTVSTHTGVATKGAWLLHLVESKSHATLGDAGAAHTAAVKALSTAPSEEKRSELAALFNELRIATNG